MHADHHLGLMGIILAKAKITKDPIFVLIPDILQSWLNYCYEFHESIKDSVISISNYDLLAFRPNRTKVMTLKRDLCTKLNIKAIDTVLVRHCHDSYGIGLVFNNNKKIVYR